MRSIFFKVPPAGIKLFSSLSKNLTPKAAAAPQPPSFVALPPKPIIIFVQPFLRASAISSPTP